MTIEVSQLPIIDWEQAIKLAGNKKEVAEEILSLYLKSLPQEISAILESHQAQQFPELLRRVHKLHGATCYCGLPRLKTVLHHLETGLKNNIMLDRLDILINQLNTEASLLLEHSPGIPSSK